MAIGAFPAAKLAALAFKQISKPIAKVISNNAKNHPFFRKYVCIPPAQTFHWMEVKYKMWVMNLGRNNATVTPLSENMAIELGANLLGEIIVFSIAAAVLIFEYVRSSQKEAKKEAKAKQEQLDIALAITELSFRCEQQEVQIREMTRILADLDSRTFFNFGHKDHKKEIAALPLNAVSDNSQVFFGNYHSPCGIVSEALNYIETALFNDTTRLGY